MEAEIMKRLTKMRLFLMFDLMIFNDFEGNVRIYQRQLSGKRAIVQLNGVTFGTRGY